MERIIEHIERLLLWHDCVIIPDFGGFVLQTLPSAYLGDENAFAPTRKEIVFNPTLTHNDGLLAESYMRRYSSDFTKAQMSVRKDVAEMKEHLNDDSELQLGSIGVFFKKDERLIFMPAKNSDDLFSITSFGLPVFHYLPLSAHHAIAGYADNAQETAVKQEFTSEKVSKQDKNVIYRIPITRTFLHTIVAVAAAVLLFILLTTPVGDVNNSSYSAGFVPHEIMPKKVAEETITDALSAFSQTKDVATLSEQPIENPTLSPATETATPTITETPIPITSTTSPTSTASSASTTSPTSKTPPTSTVPTPPPTATAVSPTATNVGSVQYYVIIGSWKTRAQAQKHINQLKGTDTANADILESDGRFRVFAGCFSSQKEAQSYRDKLRRNPKHSDAWVHPAK